MAYNTNGWDLTEPLLAAAPPAISADHLTYTFTIRDGVKWHDGQPLTPADVLFTFKAAACPLADTAWARSFLTDLADIQIDGRAVRFIMSKPNVYNVRDRKSTRLNSSHTVISYAVFCLKKKKNQPGARPARPAAGPGPRESYALRQRV